MLYFLILFGLCFTFAAIAILTVSVVVQIVSPEDSTHFVTKLIVNILLFVSSLQFFYIGILGEYVLSIIKYLE